LESDTQEPDHSDVDNDDVADESDSKNNNIDRQVMAHDKKYHTKI